jgi:hypothetical protein
MHHPVAVTPSQLVSLQLLLLLLLLLQLNTT